MSAHPTYPEGQCTRYVADNWTAPVGPYWGDAARWLDSARLAGYWITASPQVGAIAVWGRNRGGALADGHVALVTAVSPLLTVSESNWSNSLRVDTRVVDAASAAGIAGYILPILEEDVPLTPDDRTDLATALVLSLYSSVLHRSADDDPAGRDFWIGQCVTHGQGPATRAFLANPESRADVASEAAEPHGGPQP